MRNAFEQPFPTAESQPVPIPPSKSRRRKLDISVDATVADQPERDTFINKTMNTKKMLDQLCAELPVELAQELSRAENHLIQLAFNATVPEELRHIPSIDNTTIAGALLRRLQDLVREITLAPKESRAYTAELALAELSVEIENPTDSAIRGIVTLIAEGLQREQNIHLNELSTDYGPLLQLLQSYAQKAMALRALQSLGYIKPIPALHWRVDRTMTEYEQRSGLRLESLFEEMSLEGGAKRPMTVLEIGPGSGQAKHERSHQFGEAVNDYGISDALYFPITPIIEQMIDFKKLEKESGRLSKKERALIVESITQAIMLRDNTMGQDVVEYDNQRLDQLGRDVNELWPLAEEAVKKLNDKSVILDTSNTIDQHGTLVYPEKVKLSEQSQSLKKALDLLKKSWSKRFETIEARGDLYGLMDVHPENVMIADMRSVNHLAPNQVDATIAIRSSVYLEGESWKQWLKDVYNTLSPKGFTLDDSVRENFGSSYRIAELLEVQRDLQKNGTCHIAIIVGPNVTGEDLRKDNIPGTLVMVKDPAMLLTIQKYLLPGYSMRNLSDIAEDTTYLRSLDKAGATAQKVSAVMGRVPARRQRAVA